MADVIDYPGITRLDRDPRRVLDRADDAGLTRVLVVGETADGGFYFASSAADGGSVLWDLERARHRLMLITDELERNE